MSLEKSNISWSAAQLRGMVKSGKVNFDHLVQRGYVWEQTRKSALIESLILGYPIPPIFAKRIDDGTGKRGGNIYYIMDGKQRLSAIADFLNDGWALTMLPPVVYMDDLDDEEKTADITGKRFSELPEGLQEKLKTSMLSVTYFDCLTDEEERELFKRLNAGKPLSAKSKALAACKDIDKLMEVGSHPLFGEMLTDKAKQNKNQVSIVAKCYTMLAEDVEDISFETKVFNPSLEWLEMSDSESKELWGLFSDIMVVHSLLVERKSRKVAKKLYTETHLVSLIPFFEEASQRDISAELMADWLTCFYTVERGASISAAYNAACGGASAKPTNIKARNAALLESFNSFFAEDDFSDIDPDVVRQQLAERGIVNGEVVDPGKLAQDPFIQQVMADVDALAEEAI